MTNLNVLLAFQNSERFKEVQDALIPLNRLKYFESRDGVDVLFKIANSIPKVLMTEENLPKKSGINLCDWALNQRNLQDMTLILVTDKEQIPEFADAAASGRLQLVRPILDPVEVKLAFVRALNYDSGAHQMEFRTRIVQSGEVVIKEGDTAASVFLVRTGTLRAFKSTRGEQKFLGDIGPGEFVGEMAYINQEMRSASVIADTDCELIEIPIHQVDQVLFQKPSWAKALMKTLSKRLKMANQATN